MNNTDIETFLMLVNTKNITRTAENLYISQPTVSRRLKHLEEELGYSLIIREKGEKKISLTPSGEDFIPFAEQWSLLYRHMQESTAKRQKYYLSVGGADTLNNAIMLPLYNDIWRNRRDEMELEISTHYSEQLYNLLETHGIDIGFVFHYLDYKSITAEPIIEETMYIVQPDHPSAIRKNSIHTDELSPENEIYLSWEPHYEIWHNQWMRNGRPGISADTYSLLDHFMELPGAWLIAPYSVIKTLKETHNLLVSRIENEVQPPKRITYLLRNKFESSNVQAGVTKFLSIFSTYLHTTYADDKDSISISI